ncbi:hypothetical protein Lalb_Chr02g0146951 [Lupinus albus]|uniref:Uncharacterized protein n=1 Tax=Lupinus albus TaxID=3870 RepID=A0A6A4QVF8_LUPAL|nr:hypothetical protein Lalb_Chr02g0146951 [Lupinus albus]
MASILLLLEALIRCSHHELLTQHQNWKEKEINFFRPIIKVEKQGKESTSFDNFDCFWSLLNDHNEETKPWNLAECCIWP